MIPITTAPVQARPVPKAPGIPLAGSIPYLFSNPFMFLEDAWRFQGDIFRLDLGVTDAVVLSHPRHVQTILRDKVRNYRKGGNMWASVRSMFGNGLVVSEGDFWLRQRRMMQPHFHRRYIAGLFDLMLGEIDRQMDEWPQTADTFDISNALNQITMRVIVRTMFGTALDDKEFYAISEAMTHALDYLLLGVVGESLPSWVPLPGKARYQAGRETFDRIVYKMIDKARQGGQETHLLAMLLNTVDAETGEQMTDEQLRDEIATIFVAGYETTAIALAWAVDFLARDRHLQDRIWTEVTDVIGPNAPDLKTFRDLDLVKRTFQEALRIRPSAWFLPRETLEDDEIDGYHIPAGTQIALLLKHVQHHPQHWREPQTFDPDRFLPERMKRRHPFAYAPFGAGQRQCIGRDFAYMEGQLILARLLQRYEFKPTGPQAEMQLSTTLRPKGGVQVHMCEHVCSMKKVRAL